jgi:hypothetical protein
LHAVPQAPQLVALVRGASQPSPGSPLQSPKPAAQLATPQTPPTQFGVPPAAEQTLPQAPQLVTLLSDVSQPLLAMPSQSAYPAAHDGTQVPDGQLVVPLALVHVTPQAPQLVTLLSDASQPLPALPSQSA